MAKIEKKNIDVAEVAETPEQPKKDPGVKKAAKGLQIGSIGNEVKALQKLLGIEETGIFDRKTEKAVKAAIRP